MLVSEFMLISHQMCTNSDIIWYCIHSGFPLHCSP